MRAAGSATLGAVLTNDSGDNDDPTLVQNVYNDGAGYNDIAGSQTFTAYAPFQVVLASLSVTKAALVIDDGLGNTDPTAKAIPGATVRYTITVTNNGTAAATNITVRDTVPGELAYSAGTWQVTAGGGGAYVEDDSGDPLLEVTGAVINGGGETMTIEYEAVIQ